MNHWIYDKETLANMYCSVFEDYATTERHIFVIHDLRNDLPQLMQFLEKAIKNSERFIGFNNLAFDSQILQFIINNHKKWVNLGGCEIARLISEQANKTITKANKKEYIEFPLWKQSTKQIDLYKMNHWDNPAKRSSLKWIQFSMDWHNVQEMPIEHTSIITTQEEIDLIVSYCINDVSSTKEIYNRSKELLRLRQSLTQEYKIDLYSASEPRITKEIFGQILSEKAGIDKADLKIMRTPRDKIVLKDIVLPYVKFETPEFQSVLNYFNSKTIAGNNLKGAVKYSIKHKGVQTDYGLGGIHGCRDKGIYEAGKGMIIMTSDVTSYYPNLAIRNKWSPAQLPNQAFCELYEWFFDERVRIPKKDPKNAVYKLILNGTFGLSIDENSFLYDPLFGMKITVNGQLSLSMLYEMLSTKIPHSIPMMQNTDGLEMMIPEEYYNLYMSICAEWEEMTQLKLEHDKYKKLILFDVNNYIGVFYEKKAKSKEEYDAVLKSNPHYPSRTDGEDYYYTPVKCKGRFEFTNLALHKDKSFLIIPKAIYNHLIYGIKPEVTIAQNQNIYDYCAGVKAKDPWIIEEHSIRKGIYTVKPLQQIVRYYVSKACKTCPDEEIQYKSEQEMKDDLLKVGWEYLDDRWYSPDADGINHSVDLKTAWASVYVTKLEEGDVKLIKKHPDGRRIQVEAGRWLQTTFNQYVEKPFDAYNVNLDYYLESIYKEINSVDTTITRKYTQLSMF